MNGATQYFNFNAEKAVGSTQLRNFCWSTLQPLGHSGQVRAVLEPEGSISADTHKPHAEGRGTDKTAGTIKPSSSRYGLLHHPGVTSVTKASCLESY